MTTKTKEPDTVYQIAGWQGDRGWNRYPSFANEPIENAAYAERGATWWIRTGFRLMQNGLSVGLTTSHADAIRWVALGVWDPAWDRLA